MTASQAVSGHIGIDRLTAAAHVLELAHLTPQLNGTHPYVRMLRVPAPAAPADVLPAEAVLDRCVTTDTGVAVLARVGCAVVFIESSGRGTSIRVAAPSHDLAESLAATLRQRLPDPPPETIAVRLWYANREGSPTWIDRAIDAPPWDVIAGNYPSEVAATLRHLVQLVRPVLSGRLILWHGPPGTGKTTALRALIREWQPWCLPQYISDAERFFSDAGYMTTVLTTPAATAHAPTLTSSARPDGVWRLVVAEDADEYLRATARRDAGAALGRLLNLCDGVLGQGLNVLVLLTTNEDVVRLHPALTRPGRCLASLSFRPFESAEASSWLGRAAPHAATLAELLELRGDIQRMQTTARQSNVGAYL